MKRIISYVALIILFSALGVLGLLNQPIERPNQDIIGKTYYHYNTETGEYEQFMINNDEISYTGSIYDLEGCKEYTYSSETNIVKLDCNKAFVLGGGKQGLIIDMSDKRNFFYEDEESSYNYEFQKRFQTTESMYKSSGENALSSITIDKEELEDLIKSKNSTHYIYLKTPSCTNECTLFNHAFLEFSKEENIHYINLETLTSKDIKDLHEEYKTFAENYNSYDKSYPQVLVVGNSELKDIIKINIKGFDLSEYKNYVEKYGEENE